MVRIIWYFNCAHGRNSWPCLTRRCVTVGLWVSKSHPGSRRPHIIQKHVPGAPIDGLMLLVCVLTAPEPKTSYMSVNFSKPCRTENSLKCMHGVHFLGP